jgi:Uma2 family endonuclease
MASNIKHLMTVADLDAFPDDDGNRYELIEGELFVSYSHDIPHQLILGKLAYVLEIFVRQNPIGVVVPGPGIIFSDQDSVVPDLVFVSNERWNTIVSGEYFIAAPDLIVEILSPGSENRARDLKAKRDLYGKYGVKEYWVVDGENRSVLIFRLTGEGLEEVSILRNEDQFSSPLLPAFELKLSDIFKVPRTR